MSKSLQDQLLDLGLAKDKPKKNPRNNSRNQARNPSKNSRSRRNRRGKAGNPDHAGKQNGEISLDAAYAARDRDEKSRAEQAKAEKRAQDLERRRINTQIGEVLEGQSLNDRDGALKRNFLYKGKIRSVRVNGEQLKALNAGDLALVFLRGDYLVVQPALAEQVRKLSADHVPDLSREEPGDEEFPVPDDLVW